MEKYYIIYSDELYHYGVKGMRWGHRKDPERSTKSEPRKLSEGMKKNSDNYMKKYGLSREQADEAVRKHNQMLKRVAIGTAVTAGVIIGGVALAKYGRTYCDDVIRAGKELRTVHMDENIIDRGKFYTTQKKLDALKYKGLFGAGKKQIIATSSENIKVAGVRNAEKIYNDLMSNNAEFKSALASPSGLKLNVDYKKFNRLGLLGDGIYLKNEHGVSNPQKAQKIFLDELKKRGYGAVADWNDRANSGFKTRANIVFDTSHIMRKSVRELSDDEILKSRKLATRVLGMQARLESPGWVAYDTAIGGMTTAGVLTARSNKRLKKIGNSSKKR